MARNSYQKDLVLNRRKDSSIRSGKRLTVHTDFNEAFCTRELGIVVGRGLGNLWRQIKMVEGTINEVLNPARFQV